MCLLQVLGEPSIILASHSIDAKRCNLFFFSAAGSWGAQSKRDAAAPDERRVRAQAAGCLQGECHLDAVQSLLHVSCPLRPLFRHGSSLLHLLCPLCPLVTCCVVFVAPVVSLVSSC